MPQQVQDPQTGQGISFLPQGALENLAYSFANQPQESNQPPTVNIGGHNILDVTKSTGADRVSGFFRNQATQFIQQRQMQRGQQFLKSVHDVMGANLTPEDRIKNLMQLKAQHGTDYGLGLDEIISQTDKQADREAKYRPIGTPEIPDGFEIVGYDANGRPSVKKIKPTEAQTKDSLYASRMTQANAVFESPELADYVNNLPVVGTALSGMAPNFMKDKKYQAFEQAKRNFLNAVLRKESGAVISQQEFVNGDQQYFPQPGDKPLVLEQKRQNRLLAIDEIKRAAGGAYNKENSAVSSTPIAPPTLEQIKQAKAKGFKRYNTDTGEWLK